MGKSGAQLKANLPPYKRKRIVEEAAKLFNSNGYERTTLDSIAAALDVTKPFLYSYFENKSDILAAVCEIGIRESLDAVEAALSTHATATARLQNVVRAVALIVIERQDYIAVYQREMMSLTRADAQRILRMRHHFDQLITQLVEEGCTSGEFDVADAAMASVWIGGLVTWISTWYRPGGRRSGEDVVNNVVLSALRLVDARP